MVLHKMMMICHKLNSVMNLIFNTKVNESKISIYLSIYLSIHIYISSTPYICREDIMCSQER